MRIKLIAVGGKMPGWVEQGYNEYVKRMPRDMPLQLIEIPMPRRQKNADPQKLKIQEGESILHSLGSSDHVVALEVEGKPWSTPQLSQQMERWRMSGQDVVLLVGGPDGLSDACRARANQQWSLSPLTLPHPLVRVLLAEQLYRAWTILQGHPYHRE
ncbi:23S rRNA (pseudouridine(1915)-N(3))-methyltransferase RlmH [Hahella sp. NBU794]|uniref:23S rRNA (pseudouridine(1915)-N(3))-methyltransferase RlmH n=1 Tax=Hahella sp. NBU794 TaxID=3422590 RepID=UPI003D6F72BD